MRPRKPDLPVADCLVCRGQEGLGGERLGQEIDARFQDPVVDDALSV